MGTTTTRAAVLAGIVTEMETIEAGTSNGKGYTYNLTPEKVMRVPTFEGFRALLSAAGDGPYYFIRDDGEEISNGVVAFGTEEWESEVPVLVATRDTRSERDPFHGATSPGIVQDQMVGDAVACLTADEKRGTTAIFQTTVDRVDRDTHDVLGGWILAWIFFSVEYETPIGLP